MKKVKERKKSKNSQEQLLSTIKNIFRHFKSLGLNQTQSKY